MGGLSSPQLSLTFQPEVFHIAGCQSSGRIRIWYNWCMLSFSMSEHIPGASKVCGMCLHALHWSNQLENAQKFRLLGNLWKSVSYERWTRSRGRRAEEGGVEESRRRKSRRINGRRRKSESRRTSRWKSRGMKSRCRKSRRRKRKRKMRRRNRRSWS